MGWPLFFCPRVLVRSPLAFINLWMTGSGARDGSQAGPVRRPGSSALRFSIGPPMKREEGLTVTGRVPPLLSGKNGFPGGFSSDDRPAGKGEKNLDPPVTGC